MRISFWLAALLAVCMLLPCTAIWAQAGNDSTMEEINRNIALLGDRDQHVSDHAFVKLMNSGAPAE